MFVFSAFDDIGLYSILSLELPKHDQIIFLCTICYIICTVCIIFFYLYGSGEERKQRATVLGHEKPFQLDYLDALCASVRRDRIVLERSLNISVNVFSELDLLILKLRKNYR